MNIPYYLEFLIWRFSCGSDGILEKNLLIELWSVEFVALLRVLSILHLSIVMPLRWLAWKCEELGDYAFGVANMPTALDLIDNAMAQVASDGNKLLFDDTMMAVFEPLYTSK